MIYLDNAAMHRPKNECIEAATAILKDSWGNSSSIYDFGAKSKDILENCREIVAKSINAEPNEIIFTSGASESNSLAIDGYLAANYASRYCEICDLEHPSLLENENCLISGSITVKSDGIVEITPLPHHFYSIQAANSEIGTIQDIRAISEEIHDINGILHVDATQYYGKGKINVKELGIDMMSATGQKIGAIPGAGFLYVRDGVHLNSIIHGHQERGIRGGTENLAAIASLAKAVELIDYGVWEKVRNLKDILQFEIISSYTGKVKVNGNLNSSLPNIISVTSQDYMSDQLITLLSLNGVCVSAGSACVSSTGEISRTLKAIGLSDEEAERTIRISLSEDTTWSDISEFVRILKKCTGMLGGG